MGLATDISFGCPLEAAPDTGVFCQGSTYGLHMTDANIKLQVECKHCGAQIISPIQMDPESFKSATLLDNSYQCSACGKSAHRRSLLRQSRSTVEKNCGTTQSQMPYLWRQWSPHRLRIPNWASVRGSRYENDRAWRMRGRGGHADVVV